MEENKESNEEEMSVEDIANHADDKVDALINLLIKKGVITEEEMEAAHEDLFEDENEEGE